VQGGTMNMYAGTQAHLPPVAAGDFARSAAIETIGINVLRYALVLIFVLFGTLKFSAAEAAAIKPLVSNSPFMSWLYAFLSDQGVSSLIGTTELIAPALIAIRPFPARPPATASATAAGPSAPPLPSLFTPQAALPPLHPP